MRFGMKVCYLRFTAKNRAGELRSDEVTARNSADGVNGI